MKRVLPAIAVAALVSCTNFGGVTETLSLQEGSIDRLGCAGTLCARRTAQWPMPHGPDSGFPNPMSYSVAHGVVTDNVTKLMWEQTPPQVVLTWEDAARHCDALELGGFSWRLPTQIELLSLIDFTKSPMIDHATFPGMERGFAENSDTFWTSEAADHAETDFEGNVTFRSKNVGVVSFYGGRTGFYTTRYSGDTKPTTCRVRCVR